MVVNEVGVGFQIADQWMALGEAESALFGLFTNQSANVFEPMGAGLECLGAGGIQAAAGVLLNQAAEAHNRAQRLRHRVRRGHSVPIGRIARPVPPLG